MITPWMLVKHVLGVSNSDIELSKLTAAQFQENIRHIPFILNKFQQEIFGPKKWNILWIAVLGFTVLRFRKTKEPYVGIIGVFILLNLFIYFSSFMVLTGKNIYFHVNTAISRLMMHFSGLSLFFLAFLVKDDIEEAFRPERKDRMEGRFVFLDRDGVINKDPAGWTPHSYVTRPEDLIILPGVLKAMKLFAEGGYKTFIISNQQGVGKGYFTHKDLEAVNARMASDIKKAGGDVTAAYYCTHLTEEGCECKKPRPGMFFKAQKEFGIKNLAGRFYVGDTERDMQAGKAAGLKTILVLSGKSSREDALKWEYKPDFIFENLPEAAEFVIQADRYEDEE
jgi:D-glycero-D-manno-heptose 1,7-bisphosphate phosphatase